MKSKSLVLVLSMLAMSFVAASDAVDSAIAADVVFEDDDDEIAVADEVKKTEETIAVSQGQKPCCYCR